MSLISDFDSPFQIELSFDELVKQLEKERLEQNAQPTDKISLLLEEIYKQPALINGMGTVAEIEAHEKTISKILAPYFPIQLTDNEIKAINIPYTNVFLNLTNRFKKIIQQAGPSFDISIRSMDQHQLYVLSCCLILNQYNDTKLDFSKPIFYDIPAANGITRHYRILYNADYLHIFPTEKSLQLTSDDIKLLMDNFYDYPLWQEKFPKNSWLLRGFAIMTLYDATTENAVSTLKEKLLGVDVVNFRDSVGSIFQTIFQLPGIKVGFSVYDAADNVFSLKTFGTQMSSSLLHDVSEVQADKLLGAYVFNSLIINKDFFAVSDLETFKFQSELVESFKQQNIASFILAPVIKNDTILGVLEIISGNKNELNSINAHKLEMVMPFLVDTVERMLVQAENRIEAVIQENYTTIHRSVYWRFREEAQRYILNENSEKKYKLKEIVFKNVYPLFGQVDISGSSEIRNKAIQNDLQFQIQYLTALLFDIENLDRQQEFSNETKQLESLQSELALGIQGDSEELINQFIEEHVHGKLILLYDSFASAPIERYFLNTQKRTGDFYKNRRDYETSVQMINESMAEVIDRAQEQAQQMYPHYFERYKTDGVDHNLYVGASIVDSDSFSMSQLSALRIWQLRVICKMEITHRKMIHLLPVPLCVRSLILVYNTAMSIRFRMDEKRFDVDGSYNARFEIIKKRIDKAYVKGSTERITQQDKLSIVYSGAAEEIEYLGYIEMLQKENLLADSIEKFEVEDLKGVAGLKVLMVRIVNQ